MDLPANVANARYDWRTFANPGAELHYITTEATANERIARLASRPSPFAIGLDFEWRPTFTAGIPENPISLVQVACDDEILLVQVGAMQGFPTGLRNLLESANSTKVGVGIQCKSGLQLPFSPIIVYYDCKKLWKDHRVSVRNCVDLSLMARTVDNERWKGPYKGGIGLSRLVNVYLGRQLVKGGIQKSNWERVLSARQQEYAANDSHCALAIYRVFEEKALNLTPRVESEWFTFDAISGVLRDQQGFQWSPFNPLYDPGPLPTTLTADSGTQP
ncbi:ribonuclease H-like domain-containing protein [Russula vinacea]|nr:ribonuclease H-like domain-containing protein [Russula vinacea]